MSRLFDGVDDQMVYTVPASGINVNGAHTILIVVRQIATSTTIWQSYVETETSAPGAAATLGRNNAGQLYWAQGVTATSAITTNSTDNWIVASAKKTAGSSIPNFYKGVIGGADTHTAGGGTLVASPSIASGTIRIGGNDDFANIRVAAVAIFDRVLTDAEENGINAAKTTQSIYNLTPVWLVDDADAFATDYMGRANRTSITGTADDADDPAGWVYGISGGTSATVVAVPADATAAAPVGTITGSNDVAVAGVVADATSSAPAGVLTASSAVAGVVADAVAQAPPANQVLSAVVNAPSVTIVAVAPAGVTGSVGDATVVGVPGVAAGDAPAGVLLAGSSIVGVPADTVASAPAGVLSTGSTVAGVPADATAQAPRAATVPAVVAGTTGLVAVVFAEGVS